MLHITKWVSMHSRLSMKKDDLFGMWLANLDQTAHKDGLVVMCALLRYLDLCPSRKWLAGQKKVVNP